MQRFVASVSEVPIKVAPNRDGKVGEGQSGHEEAIEDEVEVCEACVDRNAQSVFSLVKRTPMLHLHQIIVNICLKSPGPLSIASVGVGSIPSARAGGPAASVLIQRAPTKNQAEKHGVHVATCQLRTNA